MYAGEMIAMLLAVQWIEEARPLRTKICSDSSSALVRLKDSRSHSRNTTNTIQNSNDGADSDILRGTSTHWNRRE